MTQSHNRPEHSDESAYLIRHDTSKSSSSVTEAGACEHVTYGAVCDNAVCDSAPDEEAHIGSSGRADNSEAKVDYKSFREIWSICLALWTTIFCAAMSATIVAKVQLQIGSDFGAGSLASWLGTAFLLGVTAVTPLCGQLAKSIGSGNCFVFASTLFLIGTICCAIAPSIVFVLLARFVAGMGSGGINTFAAIILARIVSPADRGLYQGGSSVLQAGGSAVGAVLGGAVADDWGWRSAFWIQVPPIILTIVVGVFNIKLDEPKSGERAWRKIKKIDWAGCFFLLTTVLAMALGLTFHNRGYNWSHPLVGGLLAVTTLGGLLLIWVERQVAEPLLPLEMFSRRQPTLLLWANMPLTAMWFARVYFQPVYLQVARGLSAYHSGQIMLPFTVVAACISLYAGWHMRYFREYKWFQTIVPAFSWIQALSLVMTWGIDTSSTRMWTELAVAGIGAIPYTTLTTALVLAVEHDEIAHAISATYVFRALGQVLGISVAAAIQQSTLQSSLKHRLAGTPSSVIEQIIDSPSSFIPTLPEAIRYQSRLAYFDATQNVFAFIAALGLALSIICVGIKPLKL